VYDVLRHIEDTLVGEVLGEDRGLGDVCLKINTIDREWEQGC
jgi:hypothetical protein